MGGTWQRGRVWWIYYFHNGRQIRESSRSADLRVAERLLKRRLQDLGRNPLVDPTTEARVKVTDLSGWNSPIGTMGGAPLRRCRTASRRSAGTSEARAHLMLPPCGSRRTRPRGLKRARSRRP